MPSFDGPILTLGGLFVAGNRMPEFTGGESGMNILAAGFAGSSADFLVDEARSTLGIDTSTVSDELAQALIGAGISRYGDPIPRNNAMARGIHYDVAMQAIDEAGFSLDQLVGGSLFNGGSSGGSATAPVQPEQSVHQNMGGGNARVY